MAYSDIVNAMNPVHYWRLEGNSNDTGTGTTLNGTDTSMEYGSDSVVAGVTSNASFNLNGSIAIATSADLDNMTITQRTVSFWVIPTLDTLVFGLFQSGGTTTGLDITMSAGVIPTIGIVSGSTADNYYGPALRANEPNHILVEYNAGAVKMYCNGNLVIDETSTKTSIAASTSGSRIGKNGSIRVGTGTFTIYDLSAKMSNLAVWNSVLTTQQKSDLFTNGAQSITRTIHFVNLPLKTEVRVYDIDNSLALLGGVEFIDGTTGSDIDIDFDVTTTLNTRIVLHNVEGDKLHFETDIAHGRQDYTYDGNLLLSEDLTYNNPGGWAQPIPVENVTLPYLTGKAGDGETLTCHQGVWTGSGTLTYSYQWYRNGVAISGETGTTYTMVATDIDLPIFCRETCDNVISNGTADTASRTWLNVKLYAIYENDVGLLIPSTSWAKVNFETEVQNINSAFSNSSGDYSLPAGDFLVIATMKYVDESNGRVCPEGRINYTGSGINAPIYGSGYSRDSNNKTSWVRSTAYIHGASAGDTVSFEHRSDTDLMTNGSVAQYCHIQIINMTPNALLLANDTADTGAYGTQTWSTIQWNNQLASSGTGITKVGNTFTLSANKDYLISYGIALANSSSSRTQRVSKAVIGGSDVPQSFSYAYMRTSADEYGDIGNMFMHKTGGSDETLELFAQAGEALVDGTVVRRVSTSSVFILDVTGANYYSSYDSTGSQLVTVTTDLPLNLAETEEVTSADLTKTDAQTLTCQNEGYWIMGSSAFVTNPAKSGSTRMTRGMRFTIGGVDQKVGESGSYQRNDQSTTDTWDMAMGTVGVYHLLSGDDVQFVSFDAGQDGNGNSYTVGNKCGFWALDINSI